MAAKDFKYLCSKVRESQKNNLKTLDLKTDLIQKCLQGHRKAQSQLYNQYADAMYNVCVRLMGDRALAQDVLQESFVMVFKNLKSFKGDSTPGAWIKRIVVNNCISQLRKKSMEITDLDEVTQMPHIEDERQDYQYEVQQIKEAMRKLPQGYKVIFSLYAVEGYDHEEIASILDVSVSNSKSQYHRAKKKIKELIKMSR